MAAYAALVSLSHILDQILHPPPLNEIIVDGEQIESLRDMVTFFIDFLEKFSGRRSGEIEDLEKRITEAAYEAEDIIESDVVTQLQETKSFALFGQTIRKGIKKFLPIQEVLKKKDVRQGIPKVIKKFISIQEELVMIRKGKGMKDARPENSGGASLSRPPFSGKNIMVGFDEHMIQIQEDLTTDEPRRRILPIVGMGGTGKTTLATNIYEDPSIIERFEICAWVTVSQEYMQREIVLFLLHQINSNIDPQERKRSADELGELLHKELFGRRYLIILDDMWNIEAWDRLQTFLPDNENGSRILVTTRQSNLAVCFGSCSPYQIGFLNEEKSWDLIREKVFGKDDCPVELEEIGKSIARRCGGLPLALVVIGGLLAKSEKTTEFWMHVEEDVTSAANYEIEEHCIKILSLSYSHLPLHLKPCVLYLAMFPKNVEIRVSRLIKLWVAEGFIKPASGKSLEEVCEGYLEDLLDRNLAMVGKRGRSGKVKTCSFHDLIRDLCSREAQKGKFLRIAKLDNPKVSPHIKSERRLSIHVGSMKEKVYKVLRSATLNRSFLSYSYWESRRCIARRLNLLRVLDVVDFYSIDEILGLINSRYITCAIPRDLHHVSSSITLLWSLQTLVVPGLISLPPEIWQMPQLRHLKSPRITLPDPPDALVDSHNIIVLENFQTLSTVEDFIWREPIIIRIPNLKNLGIHCHTSEEIGYFCLSNLVSLHKLESLVLAHSGAWENISFPVSLKKLTLSYCQIPWEDMSIVGSLPSLEVLKLQSDAAKGRNWNPNAGEFGRLKFLLIDSCELVVWRADDSHFPSLEQLHLKKLELNEIPKYFAHIQTLQMIDLNYCSTFLLTSAEGLSKERDILGYEDIQVQSFPLEKAVEMGEEGAVNESVKKAVEMGEEGAVEAGKKASDKGQTTIKLESPIGYFDEKKAAGLLGLEEDKSKIGTGLSGSFHEKSFCTTSNQNIMTEKVVASTPKSYTQELEIGQEIWDEDVPLHFILFCSIFPSDYEFTKDILVWQWIAGEDEVTEEECIKYFHELLSMDYIVASRYDHFVDQMKYKIGDKMTAFLQKQLLEPKYRKYLDSKQNDVAKVEHLSLACEEIDGVKFGVLKQCSHLQTLVIHRCYGSKVEHPPSELFLELNVLKILNLSHSNIVVLPNSVENLKELRYLDMSETPIGWLPEAICCFGNLQTLRLDGCLSLGGLPKSTSKLINLRHLVLDVVRQLQSMPAGIGKLLKLQTLSAFLVGEDDCHRIGELKDMNKLRGSFRLLKLENVKNKDEAAEACLRNKKNLTKIELRWSDVQEEKNPCEEEILESLQPPFGIQELRILFYSGGVLPSWICNPSFSELVSILLYKCRYCCSLLSLGELPSLKHLSIVENNEVMEINSVFCRNKSDQHLFAFPVLKKLTEICSFFSREQSNQDHVAFPKLEKLSFDSMSKLERWTGLEEGDFPSLRHLIVEDCPRFVALPSLARLNSLLHVEISDCPELSCLPRLPARLETLMINDCPKLKDRCCNEQCGEWSKVSRVPGFYIDNQKISP